MKSKTEAQGRAYRIEEEWATPPVRLMKDKEAFTASQQHRKLTAA